MGSEIRARELRIQGYAIWRDKSLRIGARGIRVLNKIRTSDLRKQGFGGVRVMGIRVRADGRSEDKRLQDRSFGVTGSVDHV